MKKIIWPIIIIIIAVVLGAWRFYQPKPAPQGVNNKPAEIPVIGKSVMPTGGLNFDQSVSDGTITIHIPSTEFGLAVNKEQILAKSYIPPCDENFNYCLYYTGKAYEGTNFESAGIRIQKRDDFKTQTACLTTQPDGYSGLTPKTSSTNKYATSVFLGHGNGAAGHYSNGALYRLFYNNKCYEFETRIGQSQFANYPAGAIKEFTTADQSVLQLKLKSILNTTTLSDGTKIGFP